MPVTDEQFLLALDDLKWLRKKFKQLDRGETQKMVNWEKEFDRVSLIITTYAEERFERVFGEPRARRKPSGPERRLGDRRRAEQSAGIAKKRKLDNWPVKVDASH